MKLRMSAMLERSYYQASIGCWNWSLGELWSLSMFRLIKLIRTVQDLNANHLDSGVQELSSVLFPFSPFSPWFLSPSLAMLKDKIRADYSI
jgi:hypothetical protein